METKKLFVGSLPPEFTDETLKKMFRKFGEITEVIVEKHKFTGLSKGFGYVKFSETEAALKAIEKMDQTELEGKKMLVTFAKVIKK